MATQVTGDLYVELDGKLCEIKRQMRQPGGYPFDPEKLNRFLQRAVEGRLDGQQWREENGVIYLEVTSDGATGPEWVERLEGKGFRLSDYAKSVLRSQDFKPTNGVTYRIAVRKGTLSGRITTSEIRAEAGRRNLETPNAEAACLIREKFSDEDLEDMGLSWIVVFHEPIKDSFGFPNLLGSNRSDGGRWLDAYYGGPNDRWRSTCGFAFALPQVSSD
ncbi:MAG: hypothetical protein Q8N69_01230 [bacterium]|nr:hypothetical protein [bacterium]